MARELRGRRFLITGASGGIGRNLAEQLAGVGVRLALAARSQTVLDELAGKLRQAGAEAHAISADVASEADRKRLVEVAVERLGGLDGVINNAGIAAWGHFAISTEDVL